MLGQEHEEFLREWVNDESGMRQVYEELLRFLQGFQGVEFAFKARPGVSYSLRAGHVHQQDRPLFALIDVIDDDPDNRWLSVCFYGDMITDYRESGDLIPQGLLGEDGYCFDLLTPDREEVDYLKERIREALDCISFSPQETRVQ